MDTENSLHFKAGQPIVSCNVHPVVIVSILDHFIRRNEGHRVIGTLLGVNNDGVIEIKSCFPVPHTEGEQVGVDMYFHTNMLDLHHRVSPKEVIVGWYSTGTEIDENSAMIQNDFYAKKMNNLSPIHMTVDTNLTNNTMSVKAFTSVPVVFNEKNLGSQFLPIPLEIISLDAEKIGVDVLLKTKGGDSSLRSDLENLESTIKKLESMIDSVSSYVNKVLENKVEGDSNIGRFLSSTISSLPKLDAVELERIFNNNIQDLLLVVYLANLTRTQLQLSEKVQRII